MTDIMINLKEGEKIVIDDVTTIYILEILGKKVKLGFECSHYVKVVRKELKDKQETNKSGYDHND